MTQIWYASERMDQGIKISTLVNETMIKISLYQFKKEGFDVEFDLENILKEIETIKKFLETLLLSISAIEKGGKNLFKLNSAMKLFVSELIRKRAGNQISLEEDIRNAMHEIEKIQSNKSIELEKIYLILNELYHIALNTIDQNRELILVPTR